MSELWDKNLFCVSKIVISISKSVQKKLWLLKTCSSILKCYTKQSCSVTQQKSTCFVKNSRKPCYSKTTKQKMATVNTYDASMEWTSSREERVRGRRGKSTRSLIQHLEDVVRKVCRNLCRWFRHFKVKRRLLLPALEKAKTNSVYVTSQFPCLKTKIPLFWCWCT